MVLDAVVDRDRTLRLIEEELSMIDSVSWGLDSDGGLETLLCGTRLMTPVRLEGEMQ